MTPARFFRDYWHKKPLLIRQAIPSFKAPVTRDALFDLASHEDVEARLVTQLQDNWHVESGPFSQMPDSASTPWTVLVQGVNLHHDAADELLHRFRFISDGRLDDLMISYATDGGGVGPHFDSYDVFLLQAYGRRKWQISAQQDLSLIEGAPLKILKNFVADEEYILEPGDMLYLPPHYAHDGVAVGECMTYSIGFRAPSWQELGENFLNFMVDTIDLPGRYADPELKSTDKPARIDRGMLSAVEKELEKIRFDADDIRIFLGEYLSEPKAAVYFEPPKKRFTVKKFIQMAVQRGVKLSRKSRMLYADRDLFVNGESFTMRRNDAPILTALADNRYLDGQALIAANDDVIDALHQWYEAGWLEFR